MSFTPEQFRRIESIFAEACTRTGSERIAVLDRACGDDPALRAELEALLLKDEQRRVGLDSSPFSGALREFWQADSVGLPDRIGNYQILGLLGEGGFGVVYRAEQDRPRRQVALKLLRWGAASPRAMRRFEYETQALARLDHPGVARILEAGTASIGGQTQAFFAMELVDGQRLLDYAANPSGAGKPLSIPQRLALLVQICDALQHAHQNGVIHRDLKPDNILVDADGRSRILDFGVARLADAEMAGTRTHSGQLVGTLPYMSPEQLLGDAAAVDTRCDIFAVGVVAYQLLSGRLPFESDGPSVAEQVRVLQGSEPRPLGAFGRGLRGDVQTIVCKALAKDKGRRYQTAGDLRRDIERHLRGEAIEARRDSALYVLSKTLKRHRWATAGVSLFVLFLTGFAVFAEYQAQANHLQAQRERELRESAQRAQQVASAAEREAAHERDEARGARDAAQRETVRAESTAQFLESMLGLANPDITQAVELTTLQMLDRAAPLVEQAFSGEPASEARVRANLGRAYAALGESEKAKAQLERAYYVWRWIPDTNPQDLYDVARPLYHVLTDLSDVGAHERLATFENLNRDILMRRAPELAGGLREMIRLTAANAGLEESRRALAGFMTAATLHLNPADPAWRFVADQLYIRGYRFGYRGHPDGAVDYLRAAVNVQGLIYPPAHSTIIRTLSLMAQYELKSGNAQAAEGHLRDILARLDGVLDRGHWYVSVQRGHLADCLIERGCLAEAEEILLDCYPKLLQQRGAGNGSVSTVLASLVNLYDAWKRTDDARHYRTRLAESLASNIWYPDLQADLYAAPSLRQVLGAEHSDIYDALSKLNAAFGRKRNEEPALSQLFLVLQRLPEDDPFAVIVADMLDSLTVHYMHNAGKWEIAREVFEATYHLDCCAPLRHPRKSATTRWWLGRACERVGDFERGAALATEGLRLLDQVDSSINGFDGTMRSLLGGCLMGLNQFNDAELQLTQAYYEVLDNPSVAMGDVLLGADRLLKLFDQTDRPDTMATFALEALRRRPQTSLTYNEVGWMCWLVIRSPRLQPAQYQAALAAMERAAERAPRSHVFWVMLAGARFRCGQAAAAATALDTAEQMDGAGSFEHNIWEALTRASLGDMKAGRAALERAEGQAAQPQVLRKRPGLEELLMEARESLQ